MHVPKFSKSGKDSLTGDSPRRVWKFQKGPVPEVADAQLLEAQQFLAEGRDAEVLFLPPPTAEDFVKDLVWDPYDLARRSTNVTRPYVSLEMGIPEHWRENLHKAVQATRSAAQATRHGAQQAAQATRSGVAKAQEVRAVLKGSQPEASKPTERTSGVESDLTVAQRLEREEMMILNQDWHWQHRVSFDNNQAKMHCVKRARSEQDRIVPVETYCGRTISSPTNVPGVQALVPAGAMVPPGHYHCSNCKTRLDKESPVPDYPASGIYPRFVVSWSGDPHAGDIAPVTFPSPPDPAEVTEVVLVQPGPETDDTEESLVGVLIQGEPVEPEKWQSELPVDWYHRYGTDEDGDQFLYCEAQGPNRAHCVRADGHVHPDHQWAWFYKQDRELGEHNLAKAEQARETVRQLGKPGLPDYIHYTMKPDGQGKVYLPRILVELGWCSSQKQAIRQLQAGQVQIRVTEEDLIVRGMTSASMHGRTYEAKKLAGRTIWCGPNVAVLS